MEQTRSQEILVAFRGQTYSLSCQEDDPELGLLYTQILDVTRIYPQSGKLGVKVDGKFGWQKLSTWSGLRSKLSSLGLEQPVVLRLMGSTQAEVQAVQAQKEDQTVVGFDEELRRLARRRRKTQENFSPQQGKHTFQTYKVLGDEYGNLRPSQKEAMQLLYRLAADPGIVAVMNKHRWSVGLLSEMPPEGKVGVDQVCVLGYNVNKGQEISLRLRTDDMRGFRKYLRIRETLVHELAHMVHSDHGPGFKELNSQLLKEVTHLGGDGLGLNRLMGEEDAYQGPSELDDVAVGTSPALAASSQYSGRKLKDLPGAGPAQLPPWRLPFSPPSRPPQHDPPIVRPMTSTELKEQQLRELGGVEAAEIYVDGDATPGSSPASPSHVGQSPREEHAGGAMWLPEKGHVPTRGDDDVHMGDNVDEGRGHSTWREAGTAARPVQGDPDRPVGGFSGGEADVMEVDRPQLTQSPMDGTRHYEPPRDVPGTSTPMDIAGQGHPMGGSDRNSGRQPTPGQPQQLGLQTAEGGSFGNGHAMQADPPLPSGNEGPGESSPMDSAEQGLPEGSSIQVGGEWSPSASDPVLQDLDRTMASHLDRAQRLVAELQRSYGAASVQPTLSTLARILGNVVRHPHEEKYRQLRTNTATYSVRIAAFAEARELLRIAGFERVGDSLVLKRQDAALLWVLQQALPAA